MQSFETKQDAVNHIEQCGFDQLDHRTFTTSGTYVLGHGEMDRPDIIVSRYKDGWGFTHNPYFFAGTLYASGRERCNVYADQDVCKQSEMECCA